MGCEFLIEVLWDITAENIVVKIVPRDFPVLFRNHKLRRKQGAWMPIQWRVTYRFPRSRYKLAYVRIYMVTNTLSFHMSVASIIFAMVPCLPMPQGGIYHEWQRSWKTIISAIHLLLLAVINVLISFGTASNMVMS